MHNTYRYTFELTHDEKNSRIHFLSRVHINAGNDVLKKS